MTVGTRPSFVIDMNLSPKWVDALASIGFESVHWSDVGDVRATDADIMAWARTNARVVFTFDLDFGITLALTHARGPSVLQVRMRETLPRQILSVVRAAVESHHDELAAGALVIVDETKTRVRILPL